LEKASPFGKLISRIAGGVLVAAGIWFLLHT